MATLVFINAEIVSAMAVTVVLAGIWGMLYYGPLFGDAFIHAAFTSEGRVFRPSASMAVGLARSLATAAASCWLICIGLQAIGATYPATPSSGAWAAIVMTATGVIVQAGHPWFEGRSLALFWLHSGYHLVQAAFIGAVAGHFLRK